MRLSILTFTLALLTLLSQVSSCAEDPTAHDGAGGGSSTAPPPSAIAINWNETHQTMVGFGGTMGWIHPAAGKRKEIFDLLFHQLSASVLRIQALGAETGDEGSLEPENDNDDPNSFNWDKLPIKTTEAKNAVIIAAARERGVKTIIPVAWSPPGWMKSNNSRVGGELKPDKLDEYAELWAAYLIGMKREFGIEFPYVSPQNEPDLVYIYPTCGIEAKLFGQAAAKISARLKKEKINTVVLGPDTCRIYNLENYLAAMDEVELSPRAPALTHLYDLSIPFEQVEKDRGRWEAARALTRRFKRPLWLVECANYLASGVDKGSWAEAFVWAQKMHWALTAGDCEAVCYWSLYFDKRGEGLIYSPRTDAEEYEITPKFYTSMNYFRPVRPGMIRCTTTCADPLLLVTAFRSASAKEQAPIPGKAATVGREVIVIVNRDRVARAIEWASNEVAGSSATPVADGASPTLPAAPIQWVAGVTTERKHFELVRVEHPGYFTLEPQSVTTLIRVAGPAPQAASTEATQPIIMDDLCPLELPPNQPQ